MGTMRVSHFERLIKIAPSPSPHFVERICGALLPLPWTDILFVCNEMEL